MTNTLAYCYTELITGVKCFILHAPGHGVFSSLGLIKELFGRTKKKLYDWEGMVQVKNLPLNSKQILTHVISSPSTKELLGLIYALAYYYQPFI